jgi:hypothetical protein
MDVVVCRHRSWSWGIVILMSGVLVYGGCESQPQTASPQTGSSAGKAPPGPPAPSLSQQSGAAPGANTVGPGTPGVTPQSGLPVPGGSTAPGASGQSLSGAPNNAGSAAGAQTPAQPVPSGPPVAGFEVGNIAPEIDGEDVQGDVFRLSEYRGKVVVLDFWGDW